MSDTNQFALISADRPLDDPKLDRLGYAPFAKHLAEAICRMPVRDGFVIGIYAQWGSGKSTLLNYIAHYLNEQPVNERPIIIHFNPWWFSGKENLARYLFGEIERVLASFRSKFKRLRTQFANLTEAVSDPIPDIPFLPVSPSKAVSAVGKAIKPKQPSIVDAKIEIAQILHKQKQKIIILIDDIDRLTSDEIRQLFGLIKTVADLPNTIYVLAFDKEVVCSALKAEQSIPGEIYLEKIVQLPFELSVPRPEALHQMLMERLQDIFSDSREVLFKQSRDGFYHYKWQQGIMHFVSTPRDVTRMINAISVTYLAVKGEVHPIDFIIIETLRLFCPPVYEAARRNKDEFAGIPTPLSAQTQSFHTGWWRIVPETDRDALSVLLAYCFPILDNYLNGNAIQIQDYSVLRRQKRIFMPEFFDRYFRLALPEGRITSAEMQALIGLTSDENSFVAKLLELSRQLQPDGSSRIRDFLFQLQDYVDNEIPLSNLPNMINAFFRTGDEFLIVERDRPIGFWTHGSDIELSGIIRLLLL